MSNQILINAISLIQNPNTMKNGLQMNPMLFKMIVLVTCFMLVMLYNKSKAAGIHATTIHVVAKH